MVLLIGNTTQEVDVVLTDGSVVGQRVFYQELGIFTCTLGQFLVRLVQIDTV